ncbi:protein of unknown function [Methylocaldum szegediense]|uniref:Uncharacterized protein n=1 Tax=Methylocaldum szegediense TaxID=73780 RepID=A0ABM9I082_9GAMM|nr:protein of unknown function [Methylocaldum szegediense]
MGRRVRSRRRRGASSRPFQYPDLDCGQALFSGSTQSVRRRYPGRIYLVQRNLRPERRIHALCFARIGLNDWAPDGQQLPLLQLQRRGSSWTGAVRVGHSGDAGLRLHLHQSALDAVRHLYDLRDFGAGADFALAAENAERAPNLKKGTPLVSRPMLDGGKVCRSWRLYDVRVSNIVA